MPHFEVRTLSGDVLDYSTIWQRTNLVLVALPQAGSGAGFLRALTALDLVFQEHDAVCVVTRDCIPGLPAPAALVADRWGEVVHIATPSQVEDLPVASELLDWLEYVARRCPECEGEAR